MILESTQPLKEVSNRNKSWGKGGRCVGPTNLKPSYVNYLEIWEPETPDFLKACPGL
jgi:hypothetical protein